MTDSEFEKLRKGQSSLGNSAPNVTEQSEQVSATATANLETELQYEKNARREERFIFVLVLIGIFDAYIFTHMQTWSGPIVIGLLELVLISVYARHCNIKEVTLLLDYIAATPEKVRQIKNARRGWRRRQP